MLCKLEQPWSITRRLCCGRELWNTFQNHWEFAFQVLSFWLMSPWGRSEEKRFWCWLAENVLEKNGILWVTLESTEQLRGVFSFPQRVIWLLWSRKTSAAKAMRHLNLIRMCKDLQGKLSSFSVIGLETFQMAPRAGALPWTRKKCPQSN